MSDDLKKAIINTIHLSRIEPNEEDMEKYIGHAERVIKYFERLSELDTSNISPTSHATEALSLLRPDRVRAFENTEGIKKLMPETDGEFMQVPKVI